ncbi:hypothetical protein [Cellulosimicrobium sp. CUA-896]|uniref:hypothetical protein n=1 Tax=Cellulosimicrobium sp. CUA-896 TaxID=1517881 RepID=UPI001300E99B|nr:hypothetical protein [Cellulosimicrobium sp. CUA-896]
MQADRDDRGVGRRRRALQRGLRREGAVRELEPDDRLREVERAADRGVLRLRGDRHGALPERPRGLAEHGERALRARRLLGRAPRVLLLQLGAHAQGVLLRGAGARRVPGGVPPRGRGRLDLLQACAGQDRDGLRHEPRVSRQARPRPCGGW